MAMDPNRQHWNDEHKVLQAALRGADFDAVMQIFLPHHAAVHAGALAEGVHWSLHDEVWSGVSEAQARRLPKADTRSLAWLTWHITRIEDMTFNILALDGEQVFRAGDWQAKLKVSRTDAGHDSDDAAVRAVGDEMDLAALLDYRLAVARATREGIQRLSMADLKRKVQPERLQRLTAEGAISPACTGVLAYWGGLTLAGLMLMPFTRHNFVHLNEASRMKKSLG